jgi:hypothetical protein
MTQIKNRQNGFKLKICLIKLLHFVFSLLITQASFGQKTHDTPDGIGVPVLKSDYFWNNDRNLKMFKAKSIILKDSIINGYYAQKEYLTFIDKKLIKIEYSIKGVNYSVNLPNATGTLVFEGDTIPFINGKLNGTIVFNSFGPIGTEIKNTTIEEGYRRMVITVKDNIMETYFVYWNNVLIYEAYYKKFDLINDSKSKSHNHHDGLMYLKVYNRNGSLRSDSKF